MGLLQARPRPVCPIREQLFAQSFDEVIRQVRLLGIFALQTTSNRCLTACMLQHQHHMLGSFGAKSRLCEIWS